MGTEGADVLMVWSVWLRSGDGGGRGIKADGIRSAAEIKSLLWSSSSSSMGARCPLVRLVRRDDEVDAMTEEDVYFQ